MNLNRFEWDFSFTQSVLRNVRFDPSSHRESQQARWPSWNIVEIAEHHARKILKPSQIVWRSCLSPQRVLLQSRFPVGYFLSLREIGIGVSFISLIQPLWWWWGVISPILCSYVEMLCLLTVWFLSAVFRDVPVQEVFPSQMKRVIETFCPLSPSS